MTAGPRPTNRSPWRIGFIVAMVAGLALVIGGQWWAGRPKRTAEHFIALLSKGRCQEASTMLVDATALTTESGRVLVKGADGTAATLSEGELPLVAVIAPDFRHRDGIADYLAERYAFRVGTSGPAVRHGERKAIELHCSAEGDRVVIRTIEQSAD